MDKSPHLPIHSPAPPSEHSKSRPVWTCAALALVSPFFPIRHISIDALLPATNAATGISWWPCPDITTTQCAYLTVPRDYANPQADDTVSIFMRKVPATVARKDYLGSILINPGVSPSGACRTPEFIFLGCSRDRVARGTPWQRRGARNSVGVNMTTPKLGCYETEAQAVHATYKQTILGIPYDSRGSSALPGGTRARMEHAYLTRLNASFTATSLACLENGNRPMLESVSTAYVVQDMERIVDALGEDGLNFWGFSYGTILGSTFAAMRPHLVKRMVLDGVSNAESYHNDIYQWGVDGLVDNHKTLEGFFDSCAEAGPERCAFAKSPSGKVSTSGADLHSRLEALYSRLRDEKMKVLSCIARSLTGPGILTASDLKQVVFRGLYSPKLWPGLAQAIANAEAGNPQLLYDREYGNYEEVKPGKGNGNVFNRYMEKHGPPVTTAAIMCGDSEPAHKSLDQYAEYIHELGKSAPIGEIWALWTGFCASWKIRPGQKYDGPWSVEDGLRKTRCVQIPPLPPHTHTSPITRVHDLTTGFRAGSPSCMRAWTQTPSRLLRLRKRWPSRLGTKVRYCWFKRDTDIAREWINWAMGFRGGEFVNAEHVGCESGLLIPRFAPRNQGCCANSNRPGHLFPGNDTKSVSALSFEDQKLWDALRGLEDINTQFRHHL
ncbi:alpha/beta hydrolase fold domain-containing protein [Rhizoctonia solani AG-1 IA]|uniref:Alpha/beta hydrolase fold domain-containing protein n=1 Tax=Thanatephorus cucumeris (strain AG1-IA) TaxID=983506 RepID=L8WZF1_THACA|nr:alpha/beta hydrolase fold domain-containing protein [Rhizoctonia solani AG-1 IA]